jgi:hypothetical protein
MKSMARIGFCLAFLSLPWVVSACSSDSSDPKNSGSAGKPPVTFAGTSSVAGTNSSSGGNGSGGSGSGGSDAMAGSTSVAGAGGKGMNPHHTGGTCDLAPDCATGLMCDPAFDRGMCTADCTDDTQCEAKYGVCFEGKCWGKCDDMGACKRKGWVCSADGTPHCVAGTGTGGSGAGGGGMGGSGIGGNGVGGIAAGGGGGTGGDMANGGEGP